MANSNPLRDLSTVDIQAIQDSGPVHPIISLPRLTTIAENWDSVESTERSHNNGSCSESESEEEGSQSSAQGGVSNSKSLRSRSRSSSISSSESSDSELSDATSDSSGSSTGSCSSDDSDSDSCSSASSLSSRGRPVRAGPGKDPPQGGNTFSVREAHYDKGRVTLRLSTLQLDKKNSGYDDHNEMRSSSGNGAAPFPKVEPLGLTHETSSSSVMTARVARSNVNQQVGRPKSSPKEVRRCSCYYPFRHGIDL